jgi:tetratricopeptide (TPR) repeat protein
MTKRDPLLDTVAHCGPEELSLLAEELRTEAERTARRSPRELDRLYARLHAAADVNRSFAPWSLWIEGGTEQLLGRTERATPLLERASRSFRRRGDTHLSSRVDLALVDALACSGRHRDARRRGRRALAVFEAADDTARVVSALVNLGGVSEAQERMGEATELWRQALRRVAPDDHLRGALILTNLGGAAQSRGRFAEAERWYREAVDAFRQADAPSSTLLPTLGLAEVAGLRGDAGEALAAAERAETAAASLGDPNLLTEARLVRARLEMDTGHPDRAAEAAAEARREAEALGRSDDVARAAALALEAAGRAGGPMAAEDFSDTERLVDRALGPAAAAMLRTRLDAYHPRPAQTLRRDAALLEHHGHVVAAQMARIAAARAALREGRPRMLRSLCHEVLAARRVSPWIRLSARSLLAQVAAESDLGEAIRLQTRVVRDLEDVAGRLRSERDREAFTTQVVDDYTFLIELLLTRGDARSRRRAFDLVDRLKARPLIDELDRRRDADWADQPELAQRWNQLRSELAAVLAALEAPETDGSRYQSAAVTRRARDLARGLRAVEVEVARRLPAILPSAPRPSLRPLLRDDERYIETFISGDDLLVFELAPYGLSTRRVAGGRRRVDTLVDRLRFHLSRAAYGRRLLEAGGAPLVDQARRLLAELGSLIFGDAPSLDGVRRVWIAPDGPLHHVPMAAVEVLGHPLVEHAVTATVPGSGVLATLLATPHRRPASLGVAAAATSALPEIRHEIDDIATRFDRTDVASSAQVDDLLRLLSACDAVHVASHGAFQPLVPSGSGLRLADGWLTALDLMRAPVKATVVTCGACSSGEVATATTHTPEGILRALLTSGVRSAILAPGPLDDRLAREAANLYYARLFEDGPGEALRSAHLAIRRECPHPALWASLQLFGDSRPWEGTP